MLWLVGAIFLAGCAASAPDPPPCRNPQPREADCSYDISALLAQARFNATYELERAKDATRALGYNVTIANERAVLGTSAQGERLGIEAREGWFWWTLSREVANGSIGGLTSDEVAAMGAHECASGVGDAMNATLAEFETRTGWTRATWEPCRASGGVA